MGIWKWAWSAVQMDQLAVAAGIRLQLQTRKMSREARHKLAQQKAMSDLEGAVVHTWSKLVNFVHVCQQSHPAVLSHVDCFILPCMCYGGIQVYYAYMYIVSL